MSRTAGCDDVPSSIDLQDPMHATEWAATALHKRLWRPEFFACFAGELLARGGRYLVCDHFCGEGGMLNDQLYMTVDEQRQALLQAGFARVDELLRKGGMVLHRACHGS